MESQNGLMNKIKDSSHPLLFPTLLLQTAFIGAIILATALVKHLARTAPDAPLDVLVRRGSKGPLAGNLVTTSLSYYPRWVSFSAAELIRLAHDAHEYGRPATKG